MRYSNLFTKTLRQVPGRVRAPSYRLLLQGGYVRPVSQGLFSFTPLGMRVMRNIQTIIREEMERLGGQEVLVPLVNPREMWVSSGRDGLIERDMVRFQDRAGRDLVLSPTHEEAMVELMRSSARSYRDLPQFLYQFQTKFRDEEKTRCGLVRAREFVMKDAYSFHRSFAELNGFFPKVFAAYQEIFRRCGVSVEAAEAGVGYMGGQRSYEFLMPSECGDDYLISCDHCAYTANEDVAIGQKESFQQPLRPIRDVSVPDRQSLTVVRQLLEIPRARMLKSMLYRALEGYVMAVVRGDQDVSEEKLGAVVGRPIIGPAQRPDLDQLGLLGPWLSPLDVPETARGAITVVIDDACAESSNMLSAENTPGRVYADVNFGRDFDSDFVADITRIPDRSTCRHCGTGTLRRVRAMELGNIFRLGDFYTRAMKYWVREEDGKQTFPYMGSYGIGLGRLMSGVVDANRDEQGIIWPTELAPFRVFLMSIGKSLSVRDVVEELYQELGDQVLFDDRRESISHKLKDADLLGIPLRVIVSRDAVQEGFVEVGIRRSGETRRVHRNDLVRTIAEMLGESGDV
ncbi:MAG: proline--tRNA ligase [Spirochaeta sp.]|jgi:prolyl-tRNA synthetase|nr:proline--tRNA ligase [Spirochaeta sp.]